MSGQKVVDCDELKAEMKDFLLGRKMTDHIRSTITTADSDHTCQLCLSALTSEAAKDKVTISDPELFQCLLLNNDNNNEFESDLNGHLLLCRSCLAAFLKLGSLFQELRKLGEEFNELRLKIGKAIIVKSLGKSDREWKCWEKEVKLVGGIYPFAVKQVKGIVSETNNRSKGDPSQCGGKKGGERLGRKYGKCYQKKTSV